MFSSDNARLGAGDGKIIRDSYAASPVHPKICDTGSEAPLKQCATSITTPQREHESNPIRRGPGKIKIAPHQRRIPVAVLDETSYQFGN